MKKIWKPLIAITILGVFFASSFTVFASDGIDPNVVSLDSKAYSSKAQLQNDIYKYLSDPDVDEVLVTDASDDIDKSEIQEIPDISTATTTPVYYIVKNVKRLKDFTGKRDIASATGQPGDSLTISTSKTVATTVGATFGASYKTISGAVGWNVTGTTKVKVACKAKVPKYRNKKRIKSMTLHARPVYCVKQYDVYKYVPGYLNEKRGTSDTKKAYTGVSFIKTYKYK